MDTPKIENEPAKGEEKGKSGEENCGGSGGQTRLGHQSPENRVSEWRPTHACPSPKLSQPRMSRTIPGAAKPKAASHAQPQRTAKGNRRRRHTTDQRKPHGRHRHKPRPHNPPRPPQQSCKMQWCPHECGTLQKPSKASRGAHQGDTGKNRPEVRPRHPIPRTHPMIEPKALPHHGENTPEPHTATHDPRTPLPVRNTPVKPQYTNLRTLQTWQPAPSPQTALHTPLDPLNGGPTQPGTTQPRTLGCDTQIPHTTP